MNIRQWRGPGYRVTSSEDVFFKTPLPELTLFHFSTPYFEIEPHPGEFSIKLVLRGEERYIFDRREVTLRPGQVLLVNAGERYASVIDRPTESLSIFFCRNEAKEAASSLIETTEELLEVPDVSGSMPSVAQVAFSGSPGLRSCLGNAVSAVDAEDNAAAEEAVRRLLLAALAETWKIAPPHALSHVRRTTTRDELVARVLRARTFIDDSAGLNMNLDRLAYEACLSRYHFLRVFSAVVGETPVAYARRRRLEHASRALKRGDDPRRAALSAGYKDFRAFRRAYKKLLAQQQR